MTKKKEKLFKVSWQGSTVVTAKNEYEAKNLAGVIDILVDSEVQAEEVNKNLEPKKDKQQIIGYMIETTSERYPISEIFKTKRLARKELNRLIRETFQIATIIK